MNNFKGYHLYCNFFYHLRSGWNRKNHPNVTFLWYEDILEDLHKTIRDLSCFLDHPLTSENVETIAHLLSFENMKLNPMVNPTFGLAREKTFMRKGIVGDWKNYFDENMIATWNAWIKRNADGIGLKELEDTS